MTHPIHPLAGTVEEVRAFEAAAAKAAPAAVAAPDAETIIRDLVDHIEQNTCEHHETHRGGAIWEICSDCGAKWADDRGGKPAFQWPEAVERAREFLSAAAPAVPAPVVLPEPVAWQCVSNGIPVHIAAFKKPKSKDGEYLPLYTEQQVRALLATATGLPAQAVEPLCWVNEDELPESMSEEAYSALFPHSKVDVVRMFPIFAAPQAPAADALDASTFEQRMSDWQHADALDAARYRGMRNKLYGENISIGEATLIFKVTGNCPHISEFDAGIDAAIAAQAAQKGRAA